MARKKLAFVKYKHVTEGIGDDKTEDKNAVLLVFNRRLHPLEAMGIAHLISEDIKEGNKRG